MEETKTLFLFWVTRRSGARGVTTGGAVCGGARGVAMKVGASAWGPITMGGATAGRATSRASVLAGREGGGEESWTIWLNNSCLLSQGETIHVHVVIILKYTHLASLFSTCNMSPESFFKLIDWNLWYVQKKFIFVMSPGHASLIAIYKRI